MDKKKIYIVFEVALSKIAGIFFFFYNRLMNMCFSDRKNGSMLEPHFGEDGEEVGWLEASLLV